MLNIFLVIFQLTNQSHPDIFLKKDNNSTALFNEYKNKVLKPTKKEIDQNNRSRSAKLRYATRSKNKFSYPHELIKKFKNIFRFRGY